MKYTEEDADEDVFMDYFKTLLLGLRISFKAFTIVMN